MAKLLRKHPLTAFVLLAYSFTWIYNHTRGSLLTAALFHTFLNIAEYVAPLGIAGASVSRHFLQILLILGTLAVLIWRTGAQLRK